MPPERGKRRAKACRQAQRPTVEGLRARDRIVSQALSFVATVAVMSAVWAAACALGDAVAALLGVV